MRDWFLRQLAAGVGPSSILVDRLATVHLRTPSPSCHAILCSLIFGDCCRLTSAAIFLIHPARAVTASLISGLGSFCFSLWNVSGQNMCMALLHSVFRCLLKYYFFCKTFPDRPARTTPNPTQSTEFPVSPSWEWSLPSTTVNFLINVYLSLEFKLCGIVDIAFCSLLYSFFLQ